ncbi:hypothetical protein B0H17DRAFT_1154992 [Mycena rosella]|uniref:Uncharacterized protein n=1 Tax=Mycena rosella TaxID=1033263 RepID=A0AAD7AXL5_MYCRO|nr:hypothetical protein B0H17DRAFT_1154992 [Mycena rosella]
MCPVLNGSRRQYDLHRDICKTQGTNPTLGKCRDVHSCSVPVDLAGIRLIWHRYIEYIDILSSDPALKRAIFSLPAGVPHQDALQGLFRSDVSTELYVGGLGGCLLQSEVSIQGCVCGLAAGRKTSGGQREMMVANPSMVQAASHFSIHPSWTDCIGAV